MRIGLLFLGAGFALSGCSLVYDVDNLNHMGVAQDAQVRDQWAADGDRLDGRMEDALEPEDGGADCTLSLTAESGPMGLAEIVLSAVGTHCATSYTLLEADAVLGGAQTVEDGRARFLYGSVPLFDRERVLEIRDTAGGPLPGGGPYTVLLPATVERIVHVGARRTTRPLPAPGAEFGFDIDDEGRVFYNAGPPDRPAHLFLSTPGEMSVELEAGDGNDSFGAPTVSDDGALLVVGSETPSGDRRLGVFDRARGAFRSLSGPGMDTRLRNADIRHISGGFYQIVARGVPSDSFLYGTSISIAEETQIRLQVLTVSSIVPPTVAVAPAVYGFSDGMVSYIGATDTTPVRTSCQATGRVFVGDQPGAAVHSLLAFKGGCPGGEPGVWLVTGGGMTQTNLTVGTSAELLAADASLRYLFITNEITQITRSVDSSEELAGWTTIEETDPRFGAISANGEWAAFLTTDTERVFLYRVQIFE